MTLNLIADDIEKPAVGWAISQTPVAYQDAVAIMESRVAEIAAGRANELVWLLEHPPLYTAGTSARPQDLLHPDRFPVHTTGRGGQYTYHGPGQRVVYVMLDIKRRGGDIRAFVEQLERWIITTLSTFGISSGIREGRVGVWVERPDKSRDHEDKIAAIGIRVRKWISFHGISINVAPELEHFEGIVPCGIQGHGVTSLRDLGCQTDMLTLDAALMEKFAEVFETETLHEPSPNV